MSDPKKAGPAYSWETLLKVHQKDLEAVYGTFENSAVPWEVRKALGEDAVELDNNQREFYVEDPDDLKESDLKGEFESLEKLITDKALRKKWHEHVKKMGLKKAFLDAAKRMDKEIELGALVSNKPKKVPAAAAAASDELMLADDFMAPVEPPRAEPSSLLSSVPTLKPHPAQVSPATPKAGTKRAEPEARSEPPQKSAQQKDSSAPLPTYVPVNYSDIIAEESRRKSEAYYQSVFGRPTSKPKESQLAMLELSRLPRGVQADAIVKRARTLAAKE